MRITLGLPALLFLATLPGCASVLRVPDRVIRVSSFPEGASVSLDGTPSGITPCFVSVAEDRAGILTFELPDHERAEVHIRQVVNGRTWLNLLWIPVAVPGAIVIHDADDDASWRDDLAIAAGTVAVGMFASFVVDTGSDQFTIHARDPIYVTLRKKGAR